MSNFETVIYEKRNDKAYIILNRPQNLNVYNTKMRDELFQILLAVRDDADVKVIIISGAGDKAFCAGADLHEFLKVLPPASTRQARFEQDVWGLFFSLRKPVIAALHGSVSGPGLEIATCSDIRIASEDARFGVSEMGLGINPAGGSSQPLSQVVGRGYALDMLLSGKQISAAEAKKMRLVNHVVPRTELMPTVEKIADKILAHDWVVVSYAKQAIVEGFGLPFREGARLEVKIIRSLLAE